MNKPFLSDKRDKLKYLEEEDKQWKKNISVYEKEIKRLKIEIKKEEGGNNGKENK